MTSSKLLENHLRSGQSVWAAELLPTSKPTYCVDPLFPLSHIKLSYQLQRGTGSPLQVPQHHHHRHQHLLALTASHPLLSHSTLHYPLAWLSWGRQNAVHFNWFGVQSNSSQAPHMPIMSTRLSGCMGAVKN